MEISEPYRCLRCEGMAIVDPAYFRLILEMLYRFDRNEMNEVNRENLDNLYNELESMPYV